MEGITIGRPKIEDGFNSANARYDAAHTTRVFIKLNNKTDEDILAYLETVPNKQGLIKEILRKHIASITSADESK